MARWTQVKRLSEASAFRDHVAALGVDIPMVDVVEPAGVMSTLFSIDDASIGTRAVPNRWAVLPMEGWDGTDDGRPTDLVHRRWQRFATSGAGLVWGEATAVVPEARANPNQLVLDHANVADIADLRTRLADDQVSVLQLTHSGRWCRPHPGALQPRIAYRHAVLDARVDATDADVVTDRELEELVALFVDRAKLAREAGFDFVDVKACHGYLGHELLSGVDRPGPYGGDLAGRQRFMMDTIGRIRDEVPGIGVAVRLSLFDMAPHVAGPDGAGVPEAGTSFAFGGDSSGTGVDLTETHLLLDGLADLGVGLVCVTAGSPYYVPHIQRPAYFPPSDGYQPPEDPLVGVARLLSATREVAQRHPEIRFVGAGLSYLQDWLPHVAAAIVDAGWCASAGLGRMILSYPHLPADVAAGRPLDRRLICRTFSDCTTAPRNGLVSGCYPLDDFYNEREERVELARFKREAKQRLRPS